MELKYSLYATLNGNSVLIAKSCMKHDLAFIMRFYGEAYVTNENNETIFEKEF